MRIVGIYSFKDGLKTITSQYALEYKDVQQVISAIDSLSCKTKTSREKTMQGKNLYSPLALNKGFKTEFNLLGWKKHKVYCEYSQNYYVSGFTSTSLLGNNRQKPYREIDFVKNKVGVEVQFGKYAFMAYNVCAKMTIFHNIGIIDVGIEIVPVKEFAEQMSTGVSYFEQIVWDLEHRGSSEIDIPVVILGITE